MRAQVVALVALLVPLHATCGGAHSSARRGATATTGVAARSTDTIRREGNHLVGSGSVYLQEHSHNPVEWYPWSSDALGRARLEDKPIFLSIGYSSCHWCHVMEAEVFERDDVAAFLNEHFVCIKVDREERPDLDEVYMRALLSMNGGGGWPMSLFLTPSLKPFFGATYVPHDRFLAVARRGSERFRSARATVETDAREIQGQIEREVPVASAAPIDPVVLRSIATSAVDRVDLALGGFRGGTKFPTPVRWEFLLHAARKWGDASLVRALRVTLDAIATGGIRDPIGGGFHRYSTDPRWEVPHFEKMLYDSAQLASLYFEAGLALGDRRYIDVGSDTLEFLLRDMQAPDGGFYASLDADSGGHEGAYYVWAPEELVRIAGPTDGPVLSRILGVNGAGPFDGASAPNRRASFAEVAAATGRTSADVDALWTAFRPKLLDARSLRPRPRLDTKIVTAWNGLAIEALARGFEATGDMRYRDAAVKAAAWLWRVHRQSQSASLGLLRASNAGRGGGAGVLEDYAFLARGLLALFEETNDPELLERARLLLGAADARFRSPIENGWYGAEAGATPFSRSVSLDDAVEPSGSAALLAARTGLGALVLDDALGGAVDAILRAQAGALRENGLGSAGWLDAALLRSGPFYDVVIAGDDAEAVGGLERVRRAIGGPWAVSARVPAAGASGAFGEIVAAARGKASGASLAKAYVCIEGACREPTSDPGELRKLLLEGWAF